MFHSLMFRARASLKAPTGIPVEQCPTNMLVDFPSASDGGAWALTQLSCWLFLVLLDIASVDIGIYSCLTGQPSFIFSTDWFLALNRTLAANVPAAGLLS